MAKLSEDLQVIKFKQELNDLLNKYPEFSISAECDDCSDMHGVFGEWIALCDHRSDETIEPLSEGWDLNYETILVIDVQSVFNKAIDKGYYNPDMKPGVGSTFPYMCDSVRSMHENGLISSDEKIYTLIEIERYIHPLNFMSDKLFDLGITDTPENLNAIYENWSKRPMTRNEAISLGLEFTMYDQ